MSDGFREAWKREYEESYAEIDHNRRLWKETKIVNYDFVAKKVAGGTTNNWNRWPVTLKVREGENVSLESEPGSEDSYMSRKDGFESIDTIDKLFVYIRQELENGKILEVKYDKKTGCPKDVYIRHTYNNSHGSRSIHISQFRTVK